MTFLYTALFCEENIWQLAKSMEKSVGNVDALEVVFISNPLRHVVLGAQQACPVGRYIVWDYHVILMDCAAGLIYDFDSRLPFPCSTTFYFEHTLPLSTDVVADYMPQFRCIPATDYLRCFASDRAHMKGHIRAEAFPHWPMIQPQQGEHAVMLNQYWDLTLSLKDTRVFDMEAFLSRDYA